MINEISNAIPVIVGGLLAIGGGIASEFISNHFSSKREREKLLREKGEELIAQLYSHQQWLKNEKKRLVSGHEIEISQSPLERAYAIQSMYFPELEVVLNNITATMVPITKYFYECATARLSNKEKWVEMLKDNHFIPLFKAYIKEFHAAVGATVDAVKNRIET